MTKQHYKQLTAEASEEVLATAVPDGVGALYSPDGRVLYRGPEQDVDTYRLKEGTEIVAAHAFHVCFGKVKRVEFPQSVVAVGDYAFTGTEVKEVVLNDGLQYIGSMCFSGCGEIGSVHIPDTVRWLGQWSFENCYNMTDVHLSTALTELEDGMFSGCNALKEVNLHTGIQRLGIECFQGCLGLEEITLPTGITEIPYLAFDGCAGLRRVTIPPTVRVIGGSAFWACGNIETITIPQSVEVIETNPFGNTNIKDIVCEGGRFTFGGQCLYEGTKLIAYVGVSGKTIVVEDGVEEIAAEALSFNDDVEEVVLQDSVRTIRKHAFYRLDKLAKVNVPKALRMVEENAFEGCEQIVPFSLPQGVITPGRRAFVGCKEPQRYLRKLLSSIAFEEVEPLLHTLYGCTDSDMERLRKAYVKLKDNTQPERDGYSGVVLLRAKSKTDRSVMVCRIERPICEQFMTAEIIVGNELTLTDEEILAHMLHAIVFTNKETE